MRHEKITGAETKQGHNLRHSTQRIEKYDSKPRDFVSGTPAAILLWMGLSKPFIRQLARRAERHGTSLEDELLASKNICCETYFKAVARYLGVGYVGYISTSSVANPNSIDPEPSARSRLRIVNEDGRLYCAMTPTLSDLAALKSTLSTSNTLRANMVVASPKTLRRAIWSAGADDRLHQTISHLAETEPELSAKTVLSGSQGLVAGIVLTVLAGLLAAAPVLSLSVLHCALSLAFFLAILVRLRMLVEEVTDKPAEIPGFSPEMPVFTIAIALKDEAAMVANLKSSMDRLKWPRSKLDIKFVCEADDHATLRALRALPLGIEYEVVEVPPAHPRTKPKALTYALPGARGEYLVVYDAEDQPHPEQLLEAWSVFRSAPETLACLQAPLIVTNANSSWLCGLFAHEYAVLFRRALPFLARRNWPLPLGGTSNHFRVSALVTSKAWDPYNVTEDADLGYRLARLGYDVGVLTRPTVEAAPVRLDVWTNQRRRWFKGWLQTWLVLNRKPAVLHRDLGLRRVLIMQASMAGMLLSVLVHPIWFAHFLALGQAVIMVQTPTSTFAIALFALDSINIAGSYLLFIALGRKAMTSKERQQMGRSWLYIPVYWMLLSLAAWSSVRDLIMAPFVWNKTPHTPSDRNEFTDDSE